MSETIVQAMAWTTDGSQLWCVCWAAELEVEHDDGALEHVPFRSYRGDPVPRLEAERRMAWGQQTYPDIIYWLEAA